MVFILLIRGLHQLSGLAELPVQTWPLHALPTRELAGTSLAPPHHLGALVLFTGPGQGSSIRRCCCVVFVLRGFLKAYCLAQTPGSKLLASGIFQ